MVILVLVTTKVKGILVTMRLTEWDGLQIQITGGKGVQGLRGKFIGMISR